MATVHWPKSEALKSPRLKKLLKPISSIPFVLTANGDYPEGINEYIYHRVRGKLRPQQGAPSRFRLQPLGRSAAYKLASNLADLLTWAETHDAHPTTGAINWRDIRAWHIEDLYVDAMLQGYWTAHFFQYQEPSPLNPETVRTRKSTALACYSWMSANGPASPPEPSYVHDFEAEPNLSVVQLAKDACLLSYRREMRDRLVSQVVVPQRAFRKAPGDLPLPSLEHLQRFFEAIPNVPHRLAAMQMFETGMRAVEVVENSLLPGLKHQRDHSNNWYFHPSWPKTKYELGYSLSDDRMIGVLPTRDIAWFEQARMGYQCDYRILGKNFTLRKVHMPPALLQRVYKYVDSDERGERAEKRRRKGHPPIAHAYLNRDGEKLSYHALWEAFDRANRKISAPQDLTPHLLRHAYACYFLEQAIAQEAARLGVEPHSLPPEMVMQIGNTALLTIQLELGHSEFSTTQKYLKQITSGRIRLQALDLWNSFLDTIVVSEHA